jgi:preprotein translocase subunit SecF
MAAGAYSSIFIATPLLVQLKEREPGVRAGDARAVRHNAKREADRFAHVPAFADDMPLADEPDARPRGGATALGAVDDDDASAGNRAVSPGAPGRVTAGERPASGRPVAERTSAGRPQPTRKPRSQRGKG